MSELGEDFEFSCCILPPHDPREMGRFIDLASELGFDRFWLSDQTFHTDPFVMLLEAAGHGRHLPLGLALTNPFTRHPVQIARAIATLRHLVPRDNWVFALGAANPRHVLAPLGISSRNPATATSTALSAVRRLLAGETVSVHDSRIDYELSEVRLEIDPVDDVALYLGTRGPRMLYEGGRTADGMIVEALFTPDAISWAGEHIRRGRQAAGRADDPHYVAWQVTELLDPGEPIPDHAAAFARHLMSTTHESVLARFGFDPKLIGVVKAADPDSAVPDWAIQRFVAAGTADQLQQRVLQAAAAGVNSWSCSYSGGAAQTAAAMRRFADQVIRPLRGR